MDVKESMDRIEAAASSLNAIAERKHSVIRGFEVFLRNANVGVTARVEIEQDDAEPMVLGYGRVFDKWRIFWRNQPGVAATPLTDAPRQVRITLTKHLPLLLEEIARATETQLQEAEKEAEESEKFIADLGVNLEPPPKPKPRTGHVAEEGMSINEAAFLRD